MTIIRLFHQPTNQPIHSFIPVCLNVCDMYCTYEEYKLYSTQPQYSRARVKISFILQANDKKVKKH